MKLKINKITPLILGFLVISTIQGVFVSTAESAKISLDPIKHYIIRMNSNNVSFVEKQNKSVVLDNCTLKENISTQTLVQVQSATGVQKQFSLAQPAFQLSNFETGCTEIALASPKDQISLNVEQLENNLLIVIKNQPTIDNFVFKAVDSQDNVPVNFNQSSSLGFAKKSEHRENAFVLKEHSQTTNQFTNELSLEKIQVWRC